MSALSEVETHDSLPFKVDTAPMPAMDPTKLVAPSIEQVDEDPEVLRSMRGEGRYFGVGDDEAGAPGSVREALPKCNNCSQRGHLKRNCPHVICTYCGSMDDHYSQHCPKAIRCANCNERGHYRSQCPKKWKKVYCTVCDSNRHSRDRCPSIWRVYMLRNDIDQTKQTKGGLSMDMAKVYCYNCGRHGHFGDDCGDRRSSRVPNDDGSAFAGENLSSVLKEEYFDKIETGYSIANTGYSRNSSRESLYDEYANQRSYNNNNQFDYDDYEYDDAMYDEKPQSNKRAKRQRGGDNYNNGNRRNSYNNGNRQNSYNNNNVIQPTRRGNVVQGGRNNNNNNQRSHPLDFPRSNNSSHNMDNARYAQSSYNNNGNGNGNYGGNSNRKRYNSYQPFRSGVMKR